MADDLEILGRVTFDAIIDLGTPGETTPAALEEAMFKLTEWLTTLDAKPGDELLLIRHTSAPAPVEEAVHG